MFNGRKQALREGIYRSKERCTWTRSTNKTGLTKDTVKRHDSMSCLMCVKLLHHHMCELATSPSHFHLHGICCSYTCTCRLITCVSHINTISPPRLSLNYQNQQGPFNCATCEQATFIPNRHHTTSPGKRQTTTTREIFS